MVDMTTARTEVQRVAKLGRVDSGVFMTESMYDTLYLNFRNEKASLLLLNFVVPPWENLRYKTFFFPIVISPRVIRQALRRPDPIIISSSLARKA